MRIIKASAPMDFHSFLHAGYCSASPRYSGADRKEIWSDKELWDTNRAYSLELSEEVAKRNRERTRKLREKHSKQTAQEGAL
jgi:hypothetical protein